MDEVKKVRPPPPASGRWKPGQVGNPLGRPKKRPFTEAIERLLQNNPAALDVAAAAMMAKAHTGDVAAFNALCDRVQGKVPQPLGGTDDLPPIQGFAWIEPVLNTTKLIEETTNETEEEANEEERQGLLNEAHTTPGLQGSASGNST